jgi:outer membrane receptor protein involved in Fe transport
MRRAENLLIKSGVRAGLGLITLVSAATALSAESGTVEEVIVTASRREQSLQNVAASVAVVDPQQFAESGVNSLSGVLAYVPGIVVTDGGAPGQGSVSMRGVANMFDAPTVGIYVDDIPYGSVSSFANGANFALDSLLGDVERVEVIKGPQGTLFGSASMGGSLRYITKQPSLKGTEGRVSVDLSDTTGGGTNELYKGRFSMPIVDDKLGFSVSGFYQDNEGFIDQALRDEKNVNDSQLKGGSAALLYQPVDAFKIKLNYMTQRFDFGNTNQVPFNLPSGDPKYGKYQKVSAGSTPTEIKFDLYAGTAEYKADWATITLASSYQQFAQNAILDLTAAFGPFADNRLHVPVGTNTVLLNFDISTDRWVEELRFTSPNNDRLEWLFGLYYTEEKSKNFQATDVQPGPLDIVTQQFPSTYRETAAFGNITLYFTPQLDATVGMRYSSNDMGVTFTGTGVLAGPNLPRTTVSDNVETYMFNLRYRPSDTLSFYGRIANGYRPASANLGLIDPDTGQVISVPFVKADTLWSYEVGAKGNAAGGKVAYDVALYHIKWKDLQIFRSFLGANVGGNADSDVSANGVEGTLSLRPIDSLSIVGTASYAASELDSNDASIGGLSGEQLPGVPKWTFSLNADYRFPLVNSWEGFVDLGAIYQGSRKTAFDGGTSGGIVFAPGNKDFHVDSYTAVNLSAGARMGRYAASIYATNLLNKYAYQSASTTATAGTATILRPRTIGALFSVGF